MCSPKPSDPTVEEPDGEPLEGSGFETEHPATEPEPDDHSADEGVAQ
jgi:hypothetical protein